MRTWIGTLALSLLMLGLTPRLAPGAIVLLQSERYVISSDYDGNPQYAFPDSWTGPWDYDSLWEDPGLGIGRQSSEVTDASGRVMPTGYGFVQPIYSEDPRSFGTSYYRVDFQIDEPTPYTLTGTVFLEGYYLDVVDPAPQVRLSELSGNDIFVSPGLDDFIYTWWADLYSTGVLAPGSYSIEASVSLQGNTGFGFDYYGSWEFGLALPEPAAAPMLLLGLTLLVGAGGFVAKTKKREPSAAPLARIVKPGV